MMAMTDRILERLLSHGLVSSLEGWTVTAAGGGLNSNVYFAGQQEETPTFTVRSSTPGDAWKLRRETTLLKELSGRCDCIPQDVTGIDDLDEEEPPLLVHRYATGTTAPLELVTETQLAALAGCLATLHKVEQSYYAIWPAIETGPGTLDDAYRHRLTAVERYTSFAETGNDALTASIGNLYRQLAVIALHARSWQARVFSRLHGDLSRGNIMWDADSVVLIDWEYARSGDPAEDLAYLFVEQPVIARRYIAFQSAYAAAGGDRTAFARVPAYTALVALDSALWWADYAMHIGQTLSEVPDLHNRLARAEAVLNSLG